MQRGTGKNKKVRKVSTIAIIDDDLEVRVATENLILSYGLDAQTFASAEAFLSSPMVERADCLITDVQMPGMSGIDLQGALRARGCAVPMIFITAFPEERLRRQVEAGGAFGFLSKPFEAASLMSCIDKALGQRA
jgi:FixJ family two-component response regulator